MVTQESRDFKHNTKYLENGTHTTMVMKERFVIDGSGSANRNYYSIKTTEARNEMIRSLMEWGVRHNVGNKEHDCFYHKAIRLAIEYSQPPNISSSSTDVWKAQAEELKRAEKLPVEDVDAIRVVLDEVLNDLDDDDTFWDAVDALGFDFAPYFQRVDRYTGAISYQRINQKFPSQKFKKQDLDPFCRFSGILSSAQDWMFECWNEDNDSLLGYIFEALVARFMEHEMSCESCKLRHSLRWNGGFHAIGSWADVMCVSCLASYEIKSVANDDAMNKIFRFNSFRGGSYRLFYQQPAPNTRYLVVVSRGATSQRGSGTTTMQHRVALAKIQKAVPRLCSESFLTTDSTAMGPNRMRILANVSVDLQSLKKRWFLLPSLGGSCDPKKIAIDSYNDRFGAGMWAQKALEKVAEENPNNCSTSAPDDDYHTTEADDEMNLLRKALEELHTADWDASSNEGS